MRRLVSLPARLLAIALGLAVAGGAATAGGTQDPSVLRQRADVLRRESTTLERRLNSALLGLYSLDAQLQRARSQAVSLRAQRVQLARERDVVRARLQLAQNNLRTSQTRLAMLVHTLYEQEPADPLAAMLGAETVEEAISTLDDLNRSAEQQRDIATQSRDARGVLSKLLRRVRRDDARVRVLEAAAAASEVSLTSARDARTGYVSRLTAKQRFDDTQIERLDRLAQASAARTLAVVVPPEGSSPVPTSAGARTATVTATGYSSRGRTAIGLPTGWGTVAVDPGLIPLGTRLSIPGYGDGVAADTGSAVRGATIDLWFPTTEQALRWGRRVVTVTLH